MNKEAYDNACFTILGLLMAFLIAAAWVGGAYFEARDHNQATGQQVSTWDAMWLDLRVEDGAK